MEFFHRLTITYIALSCHLGQIIKYDTVSKMNWAVDARTHSIRRVIEGVLSEDWEPPNEGNPGRQVPPISDEEGCIVSFKLNELYFVLI